MVAMINLEFIDSIVERFGNRQGQRAKSFGLRSERLLEGLGVSKNVPFIPKIFSDRSIGSGRKTGSWEPVLFDVALSAALVFTLS
jgi:hypothetical protein